jgi:hypothetical protein
MAKVTIIVNKIGNTILAVADWFHNTRALRAQMLLSRHGVQFDKQGNVIGVKRYVD